MERRVVVASELRRNRGGGLEIPAESFAHHQIELGTCADVARPYFLTTHVTLSSRQAVYLSGELRAEYGPDERSAGRAADALP